MNLNRLQNVLLFLLVMVLAVSLAFCSSLSLMEYLRIFILGSAVALLFATFPRTFGASYTRKCVLGFSYAFILYALDPNTNSVIKFGATQNISNIYRLVTAILLLAALITWLIPVATRTIGVKKWCKQFSRTELYLLAALVSFGLIGMVLEVLFIHESAASFYNSLLRGTKIIDCSVVFLLITHAFNSSSHSTPGSWRYTILVIALLAFSAFISLIGGARAYSAYSSARKWKTKSGTVPGRERLLRVFSLNSEEAASLYEAGYAAGIKKWDKVHARLKRADKFKRDFVVEAEALAFIAENRYTAAISTLETLPIEYTIKSDISPGLNAITTQIKAGTEISSLPYLAGLLTLHTDRSKESRIFLDEFLISEPNHANATYFRSYNDSSVN
ncbi:MAG: hypothetical protein IZT57_04255, partial [Chloroflexi bacterium]|nr:hypothetical protein [Chloroflexota bacterium]